MVESKHAFIDEKGSDRGDGPRYGLRIPTQSQCGWSPSGDSLATVGLQVCEPDT